MRGGGGASCARRCAALPGRPEAAAKAGGRQAFAELLPHASDGERRLHADLVDRAPSGVCARFSETPREPAEIDAYADALADMLCGHPERLR